MLVVFGLLSAHLVAFPVATRAAETIQVGGNGCTLADAITAANTDSATGGCPAGDGADTIVLESGATYTLTQLVSHDSYLGKSGLPIIASDVTIEGNGATIQRQDDAPEFRILTHGGGALTIHNVTLARGYAPAGDGNSAWGGCLLSANGTLEVSNSTFSECYAATEAGAIITVRSTALITGSTFFNNFVADTDAGQGTVRASFNPITITNSTFANNTSDDAITVADWATATLSNLTVTGNHRRSVSANWGTNVSYKNSVLVAAVVANGGALNDLGNNLVGVDPQLLPLQDNGGPTMTMHPAPGSPVIDAASDCPATDQRGISRPQGSICDIGAVELIDDTPPSITPEIAGMAGTNGWYISDVDVSWIVSEPESRISTTVGCDSVSITTDTLGTTLTCSATSTGGTTTRSVTIKSDTVAPTLAPNVSPQVVDLNEPATATPNAIDNGSGIASQHCPTPVTSIPGPQSVTCEATDRAGNTATANAEYTVFVPDSTGPVITPSISGTLGNNGWYISDVSVTWSVEDIESGASSTQGCETVDITADTAGTTITCQAASLGGTSSESVIIKRDATAPSLVPTVEPDYIPFNGAAVASPNASDTGSGLASQSCEPVVTTPVGEHSITCTATDNAGNTASADATYVVFDPTPPFVSYVVDGTLGQNGWYTGDVTITWTIVELESTITATVDCETRVVSSDTAGTTITCEATSAGGIGTGSVTFKRDATAPTVIYTGNQGTYALLDTIAIHCNATDALSGLASHTCQDVSGLAMSFGTGPHTYSAVATDNAGNVGSGTASFVVQPTYADLAVLTPQYVNQASVERSALAILEVARQADQHGQSFIEQMTLINYRVQIQSAISRRYISAADGARLIAWSGML